MVVRVVVCGCPAVWQCVTVCGSALCAAVRAAVCGIMWLCVAVRLIVCGNARAAVCVTVYSSALGSIRQRAGQCTAVRQCGCPTRILVVRRVDHPFGSSLSI